MTVVMIYFHRILDKLVLSQVYNTILALCFLEDGSLKSLLCIRVLWIVVLG